MIGSMPEDLFDTLETLLRSRSPQAGFELLISRFREEKKYALVFEARLMQSRYALGLPLMQNGPLEGLSEKERSPLELAYIEAAREVGGLFLADGDIPRAWPYFRAIGDSSPVAAAIENVAPAENQESIIEIALHERVHPRKGFELILADFGICRAITFFGQYPDPLTRGDCIRLLVRTLHHELVESLQRVIAKVEGTAPETRSVAELIAGRGWLFGEYDYYVDTSHVGSIVEFSREVADRETLALAVELADYGKRLSPMFQYRGVPPFDDGFADYAVYLRALIGEGADEAVAHFRNKLVSGDPRPAEVLVALLVRLERCAEAVNVSLDHLHDIEPAQLECPSVFNLCQMAGDYVRLRELARERGDLLHFVAGVIEA